MSALVHEKVWLDKNIYSDAERNYYESLSKVGVAPILSAQSSLANEVAKARQHIKSSLECMDSVASLAGVPNTELNSKVNNLEKENAELKKVVDDLRKLVLSLQARVDSLESKSSSKVETAKIQDDTGDLHGVSQPVISKTCKKIAGILARMSSRFIKMPATLDEQEEVIRRFRSIADFPRVIAAIDCTHIRVKKIRADGGQLYINRKGFPSINVQPAPAATQDDEDDGVDLFGSDDEEESAEAARIREERLAAYNAKKSKKPALIAKSNIILDVKPWDDETDMKAMEEAVRGISTEGLLWGAAKLEPLAYGIHKLQISCVVEDDKVSVDWLTEEIEKFEDFVQSVDIAAFNKV